MDSKNGGVILFKHTSFQTNWMIVLIRKAMGTPLCHTLSPRFAPQWLRSQGLSLQVMSVLFHDGLAIYQMSTDTIMFVIESMCLFFGLHHPWRCGPKKKAVCERLLVWQHPRPQCVETSPQGKQRRTEGQFSISLQCVPPKSPNLLQNSSINPSGAIVSTRSSPLPTTPWAGCIQARTIRTVGEWPGNLAVAVELRCFPIVPIGFTLISSYFI